MGIKNYHSCAFPGRTGPKLAIPLRQPLVGVEFETEIFNRNRLIDQVEAVFDSKEVKFYPETDGSLTFTYGVEFVSSPGPASLFASPKGPLATLIGIIQGNETRLTTNAIGMHVNVSARSEEHAWATAVFGNLFGEISRRVGGRGDVYSNHAAHIFGRAQDYGKGNAVAARNRSISGDPWTCPRTGIVLPTWKVETEWRNEFRNHRSTVDFTRASIQVRYSVLVSEFAALNIGVLKKNVVDGTPVPTFTEEATKQFVAFVKTRARGNGTTAQLLRLINDRSRCIWHFGGETDIGAEQHIISNRVPLSSGLILG